MVSLDSDLERLDDLRMQDEYLYDSTTCSLREILLSCKPGYLLSVVASSLRRETNFFEDENAMEIVNRVFSNNMQYYKKNETLRKQCLSPRSDRGEFDLIQSPQTLTELYTLVDFAEGHRIWLGNGAFIQGVKDYEYDEDFIQGAEENEYDEDYYRVSCEGSRDFKFGYGLSFGGTTRDEARLGLELTAGLRDDKCTGIYLTAKREQLADRICPLNGVHLRNFLHRNHGCKISFSSISFSDDQCTILAASMLNSSCLVLLSNCSLSNGGAAFATGFGSNAGNRAREAKVRLVLMGDIPFDVPNWLLLNNNLPDTSCLEVLSVEREDDEECLAPTIESVSISYAYFPYVLPPGNSGPLRISFKSNSSLQRGFGSQEKAFSFFSALESNSRLQFLDLECLRRDQDSLLDLIPRSLSRNTGLRVLQLFMPFGYDQRFFRALFQSLRNHPSLLHFCMKRPPIPWSFHEIPLREEKKATVQCVAEVLDSNHCIETFELEPMLVDDCSWEKRVTPRLRSNVYRKKLAKFDDIRSDRMRAALASDLMGSVAQSPYLLWFALQQSRSTIVSSLSDLERVDPVDDQGTARLPGRGTKRNGSKLP